MVSFSVDVLNYYNNRKDTLNMVGAHELAHQWFGDYVTCRDFRDAWLNEGFAVFCESIWMEDIAGFDGYLAHQQAKINDYLGTIAAQEGALPLYDFPRTDPSSNYPGTIYDKGAAVLGMLRYELGDSLFFGAINEYLKRLALGNSTTDTLQKICEEYSGKDLDWFFQQWVYDKGWPILRIDENVIIYDTTGLCKLSLRVRQIDPYVQTPYINLPLEVSIFFNNDSSALKMLKINEWEETFVFDSIPLFNIITYNRGPSMRALIEIHTSRTDVEDNFSQSADIIAYPNPANNYIRLLFKKIYLNANLKVYNSLAEEVKELNFDTEKNNEVKIIDVSDLPSGVYFIVVYSGKDTDTVRISVQH
jgi:aminopeptidase N